MPPRRRNGFSKPFPMLQLCTWVYLPLLVLQFLFFVSPILPVAASVPCSLLFFAFAFGCAFYTYLACITDPIDVYLMKHIQETEGLENEQQTGKSRLCSGLCYRGPDVSAVPETNPEEMKYCWVCETNVSDHSMHCKYCNKCVSHFDHHCLWLNTCVGEANYSSFYRILWSTCCMLVVHTCCMIGIVIDIFLGGTSKDRANEWFDANAFAAVAGVNIFFILSNVVSLSAVAQLLHFHIGLQRKNLTTYQFIITDNQRRREAFQKKEERRSKRVVAVSKARQEGKQVEALRLELGQYCCAACDPLPDVESPADATNGNGAVAANGDEASGYAELSDNDADATSGDEKISISDRDLALTNAASLLESSSSQLEGNPGEDVLAAPSMTSEGDEAADTNTTSLDKSSPSQLEEREEEEMPVKKSVKDLSVGNSRGESNDNAIVDYDGSSGDMEKPTAGLSTGDGQDKTRSNVRTTDKDIQDTKSRIEETADVGTISEKDPSTSVETLL